MKAIIIPPDNNIIPINNKQLNEENLNEVFI